MSLLLSLYPITKYVCVSKLIFMNDFLRRKLYLFIIPFFAISYNLSAQVTIGLSESPLPGALLQLKTVSDTESAGGVNAYKGLGIPKVILTQKNDLTDILESPSGDYKINHVGLLVYATEQFGNNPVNCPGLYSWNGTEWIALQQEPKTLGYYNSVTEILTDAEGNQYNTASFGIAGRWMTENLRTRGLICGKLKISIKDEDGTIVYADPRFYYPGGTKTAGSVDAPATWTIQQGLLYNWAAATGMRGGDDGQASFGDEGAGGTALARGGQGICPTGWHLPSDVEWNQLEEVIATNPSLYSTENQTETWLDAWNTMAERGQYVGLAMKSITDVGSGEGIPYGYSFASNSSSKGFDALLTGTADRGVHTQFGKYVYFWTYSANGTTKAWGHQLERVIYQTTNAGGSVSRYPVDRYMLYSVRCKQD